MHSETATLQYSQMNKGQLWAKLHLVTLKYVES